jgi:hypothetical protein
LTSYLKFFFEIDDPWEPPLSRSGEFDIISLFSDSHLTLYPLYGACLEPSCASLERSGTASLEVALCRRSVSAAKSNTLTEREGEKKDG